MFLTKQGFRKIIIIGVCYFLLGTLCFLTAVILDNMGIDTPFLFVLGAVVYALDVLVVFVGRYAEGKGKLINLGNKLIRSELRPADFIKEYDFLKNADDLVIKRPSPEVLRMLVLAYDCLDDRENCLATVDEMIVTSSGKKKTLAKLVKASVLFSYDKKEEAEQLFFEAQKLKGGFMCKVLAECILKCDRAIAMGDYKIALAYNLELLERTFPKSDNLSKLITHYKLGEIYEKMQDNEKAIPHYSYCAEFGGETAVKLSAKAALERLGQL